MLKYKYFSDYLNAIADYIGLEYGSIDDGRPLSDDEKYTIRNIVHAHYEIDDSIANAANHIMDYLKTSRQWIDELNGFHS